MRQTRAFCWRLMPSTLLDSVFQAELREAITKYFTENVGTVVSCVTLWEAFKVTIRGHCISKQHGR